MHRAWSTLGSKYQPTFRSLQLRQNDERNPHPFIQEMFTEGLEQPRYTRYEGRKKGCQGE